MLRTANTKNCLRMGHLEISDGGHDLEFILGQDGAGVRTRIGLIVTPIGFSFDHYVSAR